ncbi:MAG: hypothetical protein ABIT10_00465 [Alteraurantiacibacter sp.]
MTTGAARTVLLALLAMLPAACGRQAPASSEAEAGPGPGEPQTDVFARPDDLPVFTLQPMPGYELDSFELQGDQRCSFATHQALPPLLLATGFLRHPQAKVGVLLKYGGQIVEGRVVTEGGFEAIFEAATFDTGGMIVDVARITEEPDGSGPAAPDRALLRVTMAGQDQQIIDGYWTCTFRPRASGQSRTSGPPSRTG